MKLRFDRRELAGSLADLGTLLPLAIGLVLLNGLDATGLLLTVGLFYILSGLYFGVTVPVQPMKVIGAYALASAVPALQITAAGLWMALMLLVLGLAGTLTWVRRIVPAATVRGVELAIGVLLLVQGIEFILGTTELQRSQGAAEPFLEVGSLGPVPVGLLLGLAAVVLILVLLNNRRAPAGLVVVVLGFVAGAVLGGLRGLGPIDPGLHLPALLPFGMPTAGDLVVALTALAIPQLPMTIGNAVIAQADLTHEYFGEDTARRSSPKGLAVSMGLANLGAAAVGGMPLCHGSGGLAAHYRFGARTAGSNLMIGGVFVVGALVFGDAAMALLALMPLAVLGALLCFAGIELALMVRTVREPNDFMVVLAMLGVTLATNLAIAFGVGIVLAYLVRHTRVSL